MEMKHGLYTTSDNTTWSQQVKPLSLLYCEKIVASNQDLFKWSHKHWYVTNQVDSSEVRYFDTFTPKLGHVQIIFNLAE